MNTAEFNEIIEEQLNRCRTMLVRKAEEYAQDTDRLHNFNVAAALKGETPREALSGMMVKHTVSIYDLINEGVWCGDEIWVEKITDHINYLLLLKAVLADESAKEAQAYNSINASVDN